MKNSILALYNALLEKHGMPAGQWSLWCKRPKTDEEKETVIIESILTQRTNWKNVCLAVENLKAAGLLSLERLQGAGAEKIAPHIRASGFYAQKSKYLYELSRFILEKYGGVKQMHEQSLDGLRQDLLAQKGVGPETADSILLYALEKPVFVVDEYTRRIANAKGISDSRSYDVLQKLFEAAVEKNYAQYQDFHALIVIEGKSK